MFRLSPDRTFRWRVRFAWPDESGEPRDASLVAVFRRLPADDYIARLAAITGHERRALDAAAHPDPDPPDAPDAVEAHRLTAALLDLVFDDFDEVEFEGDRSTARARLLQDLHGPLFRAYTDALGGGLRAKNSAAPPSPSPG